MGYTHYWYRTKVIPATEWEKFAEAAKVVVEAHKDLLRREFDSTSPPSINGVRVRFNGIGEDGHETFLVDRIFKPYAGQKPGDDEGRWFTFCKTARKPYDTAVCATLLALARYCPSAKVLLSSDGLWDEDGWVAARIFWAARGWSAEEIQAAGKGLWTEAEMQVA